MLFFLLKTIIKYERVVLKLILDKRKSKKLLNRLDEFTEYGMTLYYLLEEGRTDVDDLKTLFFSSDDEKTTFIYGRILENIRLEDIKISNSKYSYMNPDYELKDLNVLYTKKLIDEILNNTTGFIDINYIDTYKYLLAKY